MKPRLAYIDHSFHKKTRSTFFLREILEKDFEIVNIWDESWEGKPKLSAEDINKEGASCALFFQTLLPYKELKRIKAKIIWIPMYDGVDFDRKSIFVGLANLGAKILNFSSNLDNYSRKFGIKSMYIQYFAPKKHLDVSDYRGKVIYFWQRRKYPSFDALKKIISSQKIDKIIYKAHPDPGVSIPEISKEDIKKYNVEIISKFQSEAEYKKTLEMCNIYFAPRELEGIGMTVIEAMSRGMAVISLDNPTMNEYIKDNKNGFLYQKGREKEIDFGRIETVGLKARDECLLNLEKWRKEATAIPAFISGAFSEKNVGMIANLRVSLLSALEFPTRIYKFLINKLKRG